MEIIPYTNEWDEQVKDLLLELQQYIAGLDREGWNIAEEGARELLFKKDMDILAEKNSLMLLAAEGSSALGLIAGWTEDAVDGADFRAPKRGRVFDLVVTQKVRGQGIGRRLLGAMEDWFRGEGCESSHIEVFAYNGSARGFYAGGGYSERVIDTVKLL